MLSELYIENIAVIKKATVEFNGGFNVFTGETGAGKSILINSLNAVFGNRTSKGMIRYNTDYALIVAEFSELSKENLNYIRTLNMSLEEEESLIVERRINSSGRTSCKINSRPTAISTLKELSEGLISIHGQNDNYNLLSKGTQLKYIDALCDHDVLLQKYRELFRELISIRNEVKRISVDEDEKNRETELLLYQIEEIETANLKVGEQEELKQKQEMYSNIEKITEAVESLKTVYNGQFGIAQQLEIASADIQKLVEYMQNKADISERFESACYELKDCLEGICEIEDEIAYNPKEQQETEERLDTIYKLSSKYGETVSDILEYCEKCRGRLEQIRTSDNRKEELKERYKSGLTKLKAYADEISANREKIAKTFAQKVQDELCFLNMPNTKFEVDIKRVNLSITGRDDVQFMISANLGEPPKPIDKIASGGELSRIMLAIKSVLADKEHIATLIFDEIDSGISGVSAQKVGMKLKQLSKYCQVICITHLAQIACFADRHFLIEKKTDEGKTFTDVTKLDYEGQKRELARIISGNSESKTALSSAEEMLKEANKVM